MQNIKETQKIVLFVLVFLITFAPCKPNKAVFFFILSVLFITNKLEVWRDHGSVMEAQIQL